MASEIQFLQDLAVVTGIAALTSLVFQRLRFPLVFGLLAAGVVIGPHTPPFSLVRDEQTLRTLADLGVVLLLFGLGLDFNLRGLRRVAGAAAVVTLVEVLFMFWIGFEAAGLLGWSRLDGIFLGAMLSISSTAIIVSVLRELGRLNEEASRVVFAVLVLEDIAAVLMLVLISGYAATGSLPLQDAGLVLAKMVLFLLAIVLLGLLVVPRVVDRVARNYRAEVLVLTVLGLALVGAVLSNLAGFHVGLGAFLMGAVLAESKSRLQVVERIRSVEDYFAAIFFVSIGTLVDFQVLASYWKVVGLLVGLILVGKLLSGAVSTFLVGYSPRTAFSVGAALSQIGEFSFVIAALGLSTGTMSEYLFPVIVGAAAFTSLASPLIIRYGESLGTLLGRLGPAALQTYASVYTTWMRSVRQRPGLGTSRAVAVARRGAVVASLLLVLVLGSGLLLEALGTRELQRHGFSATVAHLSYWALVLALLIPTLFEFYRQVQRWTDEANRVRAGNGRGLGVRAVVQYSFYLVASILVGLPLVVATAPLLGQPLVALVWISIVVLAVVMLWTRIRKLHRRILKNVEALLEEEHLDLPVPEVLQALFSGEFPLDLKVESVQIGEGEFAVGRRLSELAIRSATGASVVLVERRDGAQVVPSADTVVLPGDRLTLIGAPKQVATARALVLRHSLRKESPAIQPGKLFIGDGSKWKGMSLSDASISQEYGLQVVAIVRGEAAIPNPSPSERLAAGDVLIVLGEQDSIISASGTAAGEDSAEEENSAAGSVGSR